MKTSHAFQLIFCCDIADLATEKKLKIQQSDTKFAAHAYSSAESLDKTPKQTTSSPLMKDNNIDACWALLINLLAK